jgi:hypothetical protein
MQQKRLGRPDLSQNTGKRDRGERVAVFNVNYLIAKQRESWEMKQ